MNHDLTTSEVKAIVDVLREHGGPEARLVANKIEGNDLRGARLLRYDAPEEFKKHIALLSRYLRAQLHLTTFEGNLNFEHIVDGEASNDCETKASTYVNWVYEYYLITVGYPVLLLWQRGEFEDIGDIFCHELTHVLLQEVACWAKRDVRPSDAETIGQVVERTVQRVSHIIGAALPYGWWAPGYLEKWEQRVSCNKTPGE